MRILAIHNKYLLPGGEDTVFEAETSLLRQHDHEVIEFIEDNQALQSASKWKSAFNAIWSSQAYHTLTDMILAYRPDIAHFHNTFLRISPSAYYACQKQGVPVVQTLHNYRIFCPSALLYRKGHICEECLSKFIPYPSVIHGCWQASSIKTLIPASMITFHRILQTWDKQVNVYIALTNFAKKKFVQAGLPDSKIVVKPNFIIAPVLRQEERSNFFLFVGRLSPEKGIKTLIHAWKSMKNVRLLIAGDGPLYEYIQYFKQANHLSNIEILGRIPREEILNLMRKATSLIFPSECYENFPMSIVEAFACGLPVIASNLDGRSELVEHGKTGLLFQTGDAADLNSKVNWMVEHPEQTQQMGLIARKVFEERYTAEKNYQMLIDIYQNALSARSK